MSQLILSFLQFVRKSVYYLYIYYVFIIYYILLWTLLVLLAFAFIIILIILYISSHVDLFQHVFFLLFTSALD